MSGMIGVICNDTKRYNQFVASWTNLIRRIPSDIITVLADTSDRAKGRNEIVKSFLETDKEWLVFLDDDHTFPSDHIQKLLRHNKPVVASLYLQRQPPYQPIAYSHREGPKYYPIDISQFPEDALVQVFAAGTGGMLIRRQVFETLNREDFWFRNELTSEDLTFCEDVGKVDIPIYVDLDAKIGHLTVVGINPIFNKEEEEWGVSFNLYKDFNLEVAVSNFVL